MTHQPRCCCWHDYLDHRVGGYDVGRCQVHDCGCRGYHPPMSGADRIRVGAALLVVLLLMAAAMWAARALW